MSIVGLRKYSFLFSTTIILAGLISLMTQGLNYGIDFTGGSIVQIDIGRTFTIEEVREVLAPLGLQGATVQKVGVEGLGEEESQEVMIKTPELSSAQQDELFKAFQTRFSLADEALLRLENVGAIVGGELQRQAFLALLIACVGMIAYITVRFEFRFAITAIIALLHDAAVMVGFFSITRLEVNSTFIAAILTILGYSINDTIVIYDRIRENMKNRRKEDVAQIVDNSIKQSLRRTVNTSVTTLLVLVTLFAFGGITLRPFISALIVGVVFGTYSSIFIAAPLWLAWRERSQDHKIKSKIA